MKITKKKQKKKRLDFTPCLFALEAGRLRHVFTPSIIPCSVVVNVLGCDIIVIKFKPQSRYCVQFQENIFGENMKLISAQLWVK